MNETSATAASSKARVLLVDDVPANLLALVAALEDLDCELVRAGSGRDAMKMLSTRECAVMLLDVQMPTMDGYEVARWTRKNAFTRDVPIIFLTAMHETEKDMLRGYGSGAVDFLFKPVNPTVLRSKVQIFLDLYMARRRLSEEIAAHRRTMADLEAFNYSVSHDLRAPLRSIDGFSKLLLEEHGDKLDDEGRKHLERVRGAAQRMDRLIRALLELSRITRAPLRHTNVDLTACARATFERLRADDRSRAVEVVIAPELRASGDPVLFGVVMDNLLGNAWKFTAKRDGARIEVGRQETPSGMAFFVRDNGAGFDMVYANKLFGVFERLHSASDFEGTGIGLATVRRILERHGGRVWADARPDEGATFYFTVPEDGG